MSTGLAATAQQASPGVLCEPTIGDTVVGWAWLKFQDPWLRYVQSMGFGNKARIQVNVIRIREVKHKTYTAKPEAKPSG